MMQGEISHRHQGQVAAQVIPLRPQVAGDEHPAVAGHEKSGIVCRIDDHIIERNFRKIAGNILPTAPGVGGAENMGQILIPAIAGEGDVSAVGILRIDRHPGDPALGQPGGDVAPIAAVEGD